MGRALVDETDFSFETLSKQEALERKQPRLIAMEPSFWDRLQSYLQGLEQNLRKEAERNPSSRKIALLQDELRNATRKSESLWEAREKKITLHALKNSRTEGAPPPEYALKAEQALHGELVVALRRHLPRVVQALEKFLEAPPVARPTAVRSGPPVTAPAATNAAPAAKPAEATMGAVDESLTVRALVDVPPFVGLDGKTYRLKKGDVLTLPKRMVDMLAKRGQVAVMA